MKSIIIKVECKIKKVKSIKELENKFFKSDAFIEGYKLIDYKKISKSKVEIFSIKEDFAFIIEKKGKKFIIEYLGFDSHMFLLAMIFELKNIKIIYLAKM